MTVTPVLLDAHIAIGEARVVSHASACPSSHFYHGTFTHVYYRGIPRSGFAIDEVSIAVNL